MPKPQTLQNPLHAIIFFGLCLALLVCAVKAQAQAGQRFYKVHYQVVLIPKTETAEVSINIQDARLLSEVDFNIKPEIHSDIQANGKLTMKDGRAIWLPPEVDARFSLKVKLSQQRKNKQYDSLITEDWAIFRGDDLIPAANVVTKKGAQSQATLEFKIPSTWSVNTGWERDKTKQVGEKNLPEFIIDNPERSFDRPTGWIIAGKLGTQRDQLINTAVSVSAPIGTEGLHRIEVLVFLGLVWPKIEQAFGNTPSKFLVVGGGNPMWRGGLSGPNSLFLHADRPLVSGNGTSAFIHELVHSISRIHGKQNDDWIAEGIAEFYSFEILYRAGGITKERRDKIIASLEDWSKDIQTLRKKHSTGPTTAKAALLFNDLDQEIREKTAGRYSLDNLTQKLMLERDISYRDLQVTFKRLIGSESRTLQSALLQQPVANQE